MSAFRGLGLAQHGQELPRVPAGPASAVPGRPAGAGPAPGCKKPCAWRGAPWPMARRPACRYQSAAALSSPARSQCSPSSPANSSSRPAWRGLAFQPARRHLVQGRALALQHAFVGHFLQQVLVEAPFGIALEGRLGLRFHKTARLQVPQHLRPAMPPPGLPGRRSRNAARRWRRAAGRPAPVGKASSGGSAAGAAGWPAGVALSAFPGRSATVRRAYPGCHGR